MMPRGWRRSGVFAAAMICAGAAFAQTPYDDAMRAGRDARAQGDFARAEAAFTTAMGLQPADMDVRNILALVQAYQMRYAEALETITQAQTIAPQNLEITLTRARILAWMNRYGEAADELSRVLAVRPDDAEALALKGRLALYQNQPVPARAAFEAALGADPKNLDAVLGLGDAMRAEGDEAGARIHYERARVIDPASRDVAERFAVAAAGPRWRLDAAGTHSWLSRTALADWSEQSLRLERRLGARNAIYGGVVRAKRFGVDDVEASLGGTMLLARGVQGDLMIGFTPSDNFLPVWRLASGLNIKLAEQTFALLDGSLRHYATGTIKGINAGVQHYLFDGSVDITARFINTIDAGGQHLTGWSAGVSVSPIDRLRLRAGYADAPESDAGIVASTRSWSTGIAFDVTPQLTLRLDFLRENRARSYVRRELTGGLSWKF
jgi:YaiO family outer membrane protein